MPERNKVLNMLKDAQANGLKVEEILADTLLDMITYKDQDFVFTQAGFDTVEVIGANKGTSTISFMRYNPLPVDIEKSQLYEGETNEPLEIGGHKISATLEEHGAWIRITSTLRDVHLHDIQVQYMPDLARHANETKERIALKHINSEASLQIAGGKATVNDIAATDVLTLEDIKKGILSFDAYLRRPHSKFGEKWVLVTSNPVMFDLLKDEEIRQQMIIGKQNEPLRRGSLTEYTTFNTTYITTPMLGREAVKNTAGVYVYDSYLIADKAYITTKLGKHDFDWHIVPFTATYGNELGRVASFGYTMKFGAKVVDPISIINIKSTSSYGATTPIFVPDRDAAGKPAPIAQTDIDTAITKKGFPKKLTDAEKFPQEKPVTEPEG